MSSRNLNVPSYKCLVRISNLLDPPRDLWSQVYEQNMGEWRYDVYREFDPDNVSLWDTECFQGSRNGSGAGRIYYNCVQFGNRYTGGGLGIPEPYVSMKGDGQSMDIFFSCNTYGW